MAIELRKTGDKHRINLEKTKAFPGEIKINLDWSKGGFMKKLFGGAIDLDLGCFYELKDGTKMLIDGLQFSHGRGGRRDQVTRQGCYTQKPFSGTWEMTVAEVLNRERQFLSILPELQTSNESLFTLSFMRVLHNGLRLMPLSRFQFPGTKTSS